VYLDGKGVPVTKAQRAITKDLAKMAYDYFEVIFIATDAVPPIYARAQWELGQSAGISGVYRGATGTKGYDYLYTSDQHDSVALLFVGRKDDKTLLGIGQLAEVDHSASYAGNDVGVLIPDLPPGWADAVTDTGNSYANPFIGGTGGTGGLPTTRFAYVRPSTSSVTFYVEAIKTGLLINKEYPKDGSPASGSYDVEHDSILTDSFNFTGNDNPALPLGTPQRGYASRIGHSHRQAPASGSNSLYPIYYLSEEKNDEQFAEYAFKGAAVSFAKEIRFSAAATKTGVAPDKGIAIERRFPRYLEGGKYRQLKENVDTDSTVILDTKTAKLFDTTDNPYAAVVPAGAAFSPTIPLKFTTLGTGVFSFFIEIPVYMITREKGTNNGDLQPITWKLRTGLGSELYSLDNGKSSGGCVLMGIGEIDLDWLEIYWEWLD